VGSVLVRPALVGSSPLIGITVSHRKIRALRTSVRWCIRCRVDAGGRAWRAISADGISPTIAASMKLQTVRRGSALMILISSRRQPMSLWRSMRR
jgi:hypothetical protein